MKLDWTRDEIARMRSQIPAQEREIAMLGVPGFRLPPPSFCSRAWRAKVDDLCLKRKALRDRVGERGAFTHPKIVRGYWRKGRFAVPSVSLKLAR
jgi:hypothetical protein